MCTGCGRAFAGASAYDTSPLDTSVTRSALGGGGAHAWRSHFAQFKCIAVLSHVGTCQVKVPRSAAHELLATGAAVPGGSARTHRWGIGDRCASAHLAKPKAMAHGARDACDA